MEYGWVCSWIKWNEKANDKNWRKKNKCLRAHTHNSNKQQFFTSNIAHWLCGQRLAFYYTNMRVRCACLLLFYFCLSLWTLGLAKKELCHYAWPNCYRLIIWNCINFSSGQTYCGNLCERCAFAHQIHMFLCIHYNGLAHANPFRWFSKLDKWIPSS